MSEENNNEQQIMKNKQDKDSKKYPSLVAAAFILNKKNEIFLVRAPHWSNKLVIPGGHVENGEKIEDAVIREIKEETNLDVHKAEFLKYEEILGSKDYTKKKHLVSILFKVYLKDNSPEVVLEEREGVEYFWLSARDAIKHEDIEDHTKQAIKDYLLKPKKRLLNKKCKDCEKMAEYKDGWVRAQADYKNLQQEVSKQRGEWARMSEQQILEEFIPVYDNFKLAFGHQPSDLSASQAKWTQGIEYIMKQYWKVLKNYGVEEIETVGQEFDPELHEAVSEESASAQGSSEAKESESGRILKQISPGYKMGGKVIRPAKVVVSK